MLHVTLSRPKISIINPREVALIRRVRTKHNSYSALQWRVKRMHLVPLWFGRQNDWLQLQTELQSSCNHDIRSCKHARYIAARQRHACW